MYSKQTGTDLNVAVFKHSASTRPGESVKDSIQRIKIQKLNESTGMEYRQELALDLKSGNVLDEFKCSVCAEVMLEEIYQCGNGHTICKSCRIKVTNDTCTQCQRPMTTSKGLWIRNRALESILDQMWVNCPHKVNGCSEAFRRGNVKQHAENCVYHDDVIRICGHFYNGANCNFQINRNRLQAIKEHLEKFHKPALGLVDFGNGFWISLDMLAKNVNYPVWWTDNGRQILLVIRLDVSLETVVFVAADFIKRGLKNTRKPLEFEIEIGGTYAQVPKFKLIVPVVPFKYAPTAVVSKNPAASIEGSRFKQHEQSPLFEGYFYMVKRSL